MRRVRDPTARRFLEDKLDDIRKIFAPEYIIRRGSNRGGRPSKAVVGGSRH